MRLDRLALKIQSADLPEQAVISLTGEHEQAVANYLVSWWTAAHDGILKSALGAH